MTLETPAAAETKYIVPALQRGLDILTLFSRANREITVAQACRTLGISRATGFRLFFTLEANGFIARNPNSTAYRLHSRILSLGFDYLYSLDVAEVAKAHVDRLRDKVGATVHLGVRVRTEMYYVLRAASLAAQDAMPSVPLGARHPAHAVSSGRALLLDLSEAAITELYANYAFGQLPPFVPGSIPALIAQLALERHNGYVVAQSLSYANIKHIAVPVRDASGAAVAAINISDRHFEDAELEGWVLRELASAAQEISTSLGYSGTLPLNSDR